MRLNPRRLERPARRACLALAVAGVLYLVWRFDLTGLPAEGCSPVARFAPGESLIVDRRPSDWTAGDAAFFAGPDGRLHLGLVERTRHVDGALEVWTTTDALDCPGVGSEELGWIPRRRLRGRVVMIWPW